MVSSLTSQISGFSFSSSSTTTSSSDRFIRQRRREFPDIDNEKLIMGEKSVFQVVKNNCTPFQTIDERINFLKKETDQKWRDELAKAIYGQSQNALAKRTIVSPIGMSPVTKKSTAQHGSSRVPVGRPVGYYPILTLDCPNVVDDFYTQLFSWSKKNIIAVALDHEVYAYDVQKKSAVRAATVQGCSALEWSQSGNHMIIGDQSGSISVYNLEKQKVIYEAHDQNMQHKIANSSQIDFLEKGENAVFFAGRKSGELLTVDCRQKGFKVGSTRLFTTRLTRAAYCSNKLATGDNEGVVKIWDVRKLSQEPQNILKTKSKAAIGALEWVPWSSTELLIGGGSDDRCVRLFNTFQDKVIDSVNTGSQVTGIHASSHYKEFVSVHGYSAESTLLNSCVVWNCCPYDNGMLFPYKKIEGHTKRVLASGLSPDGEKLATISPDETLKIWEIFKKAKKKQEPKSLLSLKEAFTIR